MSASGEVGGASPWIPPHPILTRCVARGTLVSTDPWGSFPLFPRGGLNRITTTTDGLRSPLVLPRRSLKPPLLSPNIAKGIFHRPWNSLGYTPLPNPFHLTTFRNASYLAKVTKGSLYAMSVMCPSFLGYSPLFDKQRDIRSRVRQEADPLGECTRKQIQ